MPLPVVVLRDISTSLGAIPLAWLGLLRWQGKRLDAGWWWIAAAFFVSFVTDVLAHFTASGQPILAFAYPMSQSVFIGWALLNDRSSKLLHVALLTVVAISVAVSRPVSTPDVIFRTIAWGSVVWIVFDQGALGRLRFAMLVYFAGGLLVWYWFAATRQFDALLAVQAVRALGVGLFCFAATDPAPQLRLSVNGV